MLSTALFEVIKPGLYTSIQDQGRFGYQQYGVPVSGAIDRYAYRMVNYILNNEQNAAAIEVTLLGLELRVLKDHLIAITGADLTVKIDGYSAPLWKSFMVYKGQKIVFKKPHTGMRAYLGVVGGIDCNSILGSCSTYERAGMNQPLQKGNIIYTFSTESWPKSRALSLDWVPKYKHEIEVRVIPSHHEVKFKEFSIRDFYEQTYTLQRGDRMGCMIKADNPLKHKSGADIISESTTFGTIQVPSNGQPIILLADSQTTGGYTTLGTVVSVDHWKIAQLQPGGKIRFKRVGIDEAEVLQKEWLENGFA